MPVTITFNTIKEKTPKHGEAIIFLNRVSSFGSEGFDPKECTVEYTWEMVDENGYTTGDTACYTSEDEACGHTPGDIYDCWKLSIQLDQYIVSDDMLWIGVDEYWESFK